MVSKKEEDWFKKFQEGTFGVKGWKARTREILKPFASPEKETLQEELEELGEQIGREWAKDNDTRRIDTPMLQKWGKELVGVKEKGADHLRREIEKVKADVTSLLS